MDWTYVHAVPQSVVPHRPASPGHGEPHPVVMHVLLQFCQKWEKICQCQTLTIFATLGQKLFQNVIKHRFQDLHWTSHEPIVRTFENSSYISWFIIPNHGTCKWLSSICDKMRLLLIVMTALKKRSGEGQKTSSSSHDVKHTRKVVWVWVIALPMCERFDGRGHF